jgi:hypothetical protein
MVQISFGPQLMYHKMINIILLQCIISIIVKSQIIIDQNKCESDNTLINIRHCGEKKASVFSTLKLY